MYFGVFVLIFLVYFMFFILFIKIYRFYFDNRIFFTSFGYENEIKSLFFEFYMFYL
ncbi:MAG: hypothetical protein K0R59_3829 [Sphingobacterium sp.]|jgi:hypothetical protein|nr:hypothetical protein [Sphingobacterium sp.]